MLALKAENISKQYRLGQVGTGTLSHDLNRFWHQVRGKEDPYLKIGEANDRANKGESEYVWSLRDINFEIEQGDAVGIIGRNGAGKSTLLKLLSKVTKPTTGKIYTNGRIASLLEVGTGFHPEMTGRENIYLNGAILGMTRKEIKRKFDEIVDFSGVERYIDTPVKRYSSGMYVRLAFAVAAHLESEILIVDEVLAVGDAEFQKKCLGKMGDVSKGEGRTVLFVSHNLTAVSQLCNSGIYLKNGILTKKDTIKNITNLYLKESEKGKSFFITEEDRNDKIFFKKITILNSNHESESSFDFNNEIIIEFEIANNGNINNANIFVTIQDAHQNRVFSAEVVLNKNQSKYQLIIEPKFLCAGSYNITTFLHVPQLFRYDELANVCHFDVIDTASEFVIHGSYHHGVVYGKYKWK
ncbi:ATP-binding cassette domain-containing protein [Kaistella flava (ex Peng et al. 2021)]|uniref:ATP-binding cassette domain-containing protein n=1 Tax=Kaistella flava (ex Peng et al. 2021) TaxID=2038776 RepID=A0A7M2Y9D5_9FLAO|nr:polysaccharide ABC transporter ATP-binding protein [Kaistella flava (ex Peng et al. 2021)]QOW10877.1 ATP-binding cassette domain-containing protein [Kaistella flava (ex Peng et al. 2021)]